MAAERHKSTNAWKTHSDQVLAQNLRDAARKILLGSFPPDRQDVLAPLVDWAVAAEQASFRECHAAIDDAVLTAWHKATAQERNEIISAAEKNHHQMLELFAHCDQTSALKTGLLNLALIFTTFIGAGLTLKQIGRELTPEVQPALPQQHQPTEPAAVMKGQSATAEDVTVSMRLEPEPEHPSGDKDSFRQNLGEMAYTAGNSMIGWGMFVFGAPLCMAGFMLPVVKSYKRKVETHNAVTYDQAYEYLAWNYRHPRRR